MKKSTMTVEEREAMLARFEAVNIWLTYVYDQKNEHKAAHAFAQTLLKTADPRVRRLFQQTLALDRQVVMTMTLFWRN
jgi:hypothetical protein